jgi:hypothetical protein
VPAGTAWHVGDVGYREAELAVPSAPELTAGGSGLLQRESPFLGCASRVLQSGEDVLEDEMGMVGQHVRWCQSFTRVVPGWSRPGSGCYVRRARRP